MVLFLLSYDFIPHARADSMTEKHPKVRRLGKQQKSIILESIRCHLLTTLDSIVGYSEILNEEFSYEPSEIMGDDDERENCISAIKNILKTALSLQKKVDLIFATALVESQNASYDIALFLQSLRHSLLTSLYAIVGNYEILIESGIKRYGQPLEDDVQKIHDSAQLLINSINKLTISSRTNKYIFSSPIEKLENSIKALMRSGAKKNHLAESRPVVAGTILIIDDQPAVLELWQRQVEFFGYKAVPAEHWSTILKAVKNTKIDLVLLQMLMLKTNSFALLKKIKLQHEFKSIPVIAISPLKKNQVAEKCFQLGAIDYLTQPLHHAIFRVRVNECIEKKQLLDKEKEYTANIQEQKQKIENFSLNGLPQSIVERLENDKTFVAERSEEASVLFADIAEFSQVIDQLSPQQTVRLLNIIFSAFDAIVDKYKVEKIKTIGDNYMAIAGIPIPNHDHAEAIAQAALAMQNTMATINKKMGINIHLRIGINSGPVIAGIIGSKKIIYDAWGKTVNLASRIEAQSQASKIQVSESTYNLLKNKYNFIYRGEIEVRSFGKLKLYFLLGPKKKRLPYGA